MNKPTATNVLGEFLVPEESVIARFEMRGEPVSKARARFTNYGSKTRAYTPQKTLEAEARVAWSFRASGGKLTSDETATFGVIAQFHNGTRQRRDVDNMLKLILDGLNGVAWVDDMQVTEVIGRKFWTDDRATARTEVVVYRVGANEEPTQPCLRCGMPFRTYSSWKNNPAGRKFCSPECGRAYRREQRERTCVECGATFHIHGETHDTKYCSLECRYKGSRITRPCPQCGEDFTRPRSVMRKGTTCSQECRILREKDRTARRKANPPGKCLVCGAGTSRKEYLRCNACKIAGKPLPEVNP